MLITCCKIRKYKEDEEEVDEQRRKKYSHSISWCTMYCIWPLFIGLHTLEHSAMVTRIKEVHND